MNQHLTPPLEGRWRRGPYDSCGRGRDKFEVCSSSALRSRILSGNNNRSVPKPARFDQAIPCHPSMTEPPPPALKATCQFNAFISPIFFRSNVMTLFKSHHNIIFEVTTYSVFLQLTHVTSFYQRQIIKETTGGLSTQTPTDLHNRKRFPPVLHPPPIKAYLTWDFRIASFGGGGQPFYFRMAALLASGG